MDLVLTVFRTAMVTGLGFTATVVVLMLTMHFPAMVTGLEFTIADVISMRETILFPAMVTGFEFTIAGMIRTNIFTAARAFPSFMFTVMCGAIFFFTYPAPFRFAYIGLFYIIKINCCITVVTISWRYVFVESFSGIK